MSTFVHSQPDWEPFEPAKAPEAAPNVVYIVLDDVGFSAMSCLRRPDRDAEHRSDRGGGRARTRSGTRRRCVHRPGPAC